MDSNSACVVGLLGGFNEMIPDLLGTAAGTEHTLRCGSSSGQSLLFLLSHFIPGEILGLDVPGRKSKVPRGSPDLFRGDPRRLCPDRRRAGREVWVLSSWSTKDSTWGRWHLLAHLPGSSQGEGWDPAQLGAPVDSPQCMAWTCQETWQILWSHGQQ